MRFSPTKLLHGLLYMTPVLLLTLAACGGGGGGSTGGGLASAYTVGGTVTGLTGTSLMLRNNGGDDESIAADGSYTFATSVANGGSYNVTVLTHPSSPTQVCTVTNASGTIASANVTNVNVNCATAYTIGVTITGAADGIGPILQNNGGDNLFIPTITTSPTNFIFSTPVADGGSYAVTQQSSARAPSQDCSFITGGSNGDGSGTVSGSDVSSVSITCTLSTVVPKFAYVTNSTVTPLGVADTVSAYTIAASGVLADAATPTSASGDQPYAVAVDPTGQFAYVVNSESDSISAYTINSSNGVLVAIADVDAGTVGTQASIATGDFPISIAIHPSGEFAYVVNKGNGTTTGSTISAYSINTSTGVLSAIDADNDTTDTQATIATGTMPYAITIDPLGKFAYVANYNSDSISAFSINQTSGALAAVGNPVATGTNPSSIAIDPLGKFVYVANNTSGDVSAYTIGISGALTPINCIISGLTTCNASNFVAGSASRSVAVADIGASQFLYVANAGGNVSAYSINLTNGLLTRINAGAVGPALTIAAGTTPISINVDPSGHFVYVANVSSNDISVYTIGVGGGLTLLQTLSTGSGPTSVTTTQ